MRGTQELADKVCTAGIFERRPLHKWPLPYTPKNVPEYVPKPWEVGREGRRTPRLEQPYVRIEIPPEIPNPQKPTNGNDGTGDVDYSIKPRYTSEEYRV